MSKNDEKNGAFHVICIQAKRSPKMNKKSVFFIKKKHIFNIRTKMKM